MKMISQLIFLLLFSYSCVNNSAQNTTVETVDAKISLVYEQSQLEYPYTGDTREFHISSNVEWKLSCDNPNVIYKKIDNENFRLTIPKWNGLSERKIELRVLTLDEVQVASMQLTQKSIIVGTEGDISFAADGSATLTTSFDAQAARLKMDGQYKLGTYTFKIKSVSLKKGYFHLNAKNLEDISYQLRLGGNTKRNFSTSGVYVTKISTDVQDPSLIYNANGLDLCFNSAVHPAPISLSGNMEIKCSVGSYLPKDGGKLRLFSQVYINDDLVNDTWDERESPWFEGSEMPGLDVWFGLTDAVGTMVIESVDFQPISLQKQPATASKCLYYDRFEQSLSTPEPKVWSKALKGNAGWHINMSETGDNSYVENGQLVLKAYSKDGKRYSAGVRSESKQWYRKCRIEASIKYEDNDKHVGYAFWLMPQYQFIEYIGWPECGEIDILENTWYDVNRYRATLHSSYIHKVEPGQSSGLPNWIGADKGYKPSDYNVYGVDLTGDEVIFYINGNKVASYANKKLPNEAEVMQWPFAKPFYTIFSIGGVEIEDAKEEEFPFYMYVDWYKVSKL